MLGARSVGRDVQTLDALQTHLANSGLLQSWGIGRPKAFVRKRVALADELGLVPFKSLHVAVVIAQPGLVGLTGLKVDLFEGVLGEETLHFADNKDSSTISVRSCSSAQTVDVALLIRGQTDLDNRGYTREIHSSSDDICRYENSVASSAVFVGNSGPLALCHAAVQNRHGRQTGGGHEDAGVKVGNRSSSRKQNRLEVLASSGLLANDSNHGRRQVGKGRNLDKELRNALMGVDLTLGDGRDELVLSDENLTAAEDSSLFAVLVGSAHDTLHAILGEVLENPGGLGCNLLSELASG
ncbi:hypothetical protein HG531_001336 [Fusarium graminearum]|nr:hypothetical protein HG531_001336 [Fusarium graminearum]